MKYEEAKLEVIYFFNQDIVTTSTLREGSDGNDVGDFGALFNNSNSNF